MARPTKAKAIARLQKALDTIPKLRQQAKGSPEFKVWRKTTEIAVGEVFGRDSGHYESFTNDLVSSLLYESYQHSLRFADLSLSAMLDEVKEWPPPTANDLLRAHDKLDKEYQEDKNQTPLPSAAQGNERTNTKEVFVIHGRDNEARETVARFLEKLGLTPVILHEQSNQGRTIIEKFEQHAQVGFAVALLTPDDVGALKSDEKNLKPRARQNVVFELGYFLGRLGRERVCALTKGNVELPSDYDGVVYISLDDGGWKMNLIRELKNADFNVDANKML